MTAEDQARAKDAILFLIDLFKRRGVAEGCEPDYDGGSCAGDLRYMAKSLKLDLGDV